MQQTDLIILTVAILSGIGALIFLLLAFFVEAYPLFLAGSILTNMVASGVLIARRQLS